MKGPVKCVKYGSLLVIVAAQLVHIGRGDSLTTVSVRAGQNVSLPCLGLTTDAVSAPGGHIVNQLIWSRCSGRETCLEIGQSDQLVIFANERVQVQQDGDRLGLDRGNWSLTISTTEADDTGIYSCAFNKQDSDHKIVQLLVLDVPERPGRPIVVRFGPRSSVLSWLPTIHIENQPVEYYVMQTRYGEKGPWPSVEAGQRTEGDETSITISGLTPFTVYTFRVVAVNEMGNSRPSATSYPIITLRERPGVAPRLTHARNRSATSIEVGWEPPANYTFNGEHTGYRLTYRPLQPSRLPGTLTEVEIHRADLRKKVISGLEPFTKYEITLQVRNPAGTSPPDTITAVTSQGVPSAPENVTLSTVTDRSLRVIWIPPRRPNGILLGYNVYWSQSAAAVQNDSLKSGDDTSFTLTTLEPETRYSVWLRAFTAVGEGSSSEPVRLMTDVSGPGEPIITNITCPSDTSLMIYWQQPEIVYRSVDMYYLLYRSVGGGDFEQRTVPPRSDSLQFSVFLPNLTTGEVYELRVQGATTSRLIPNKVYKGQQSTSAKVRLERNCQQVELVSTWRYRPDPVLSSSQLAGTLVGSLLVIIIIIGTILWRLV